MSAPASSQNHFHQNRPRQNRVDPWARLVATPDRGLLMGNRGSLHNDQGRIVRSHQLTRWIICVLEFRGRQRTVMHPGHYTELFFLDEATALAAGHRPCAECQRSRYDLFLGFWAKTQGSANTVNERIRAPQVDAALHAARWVDGRKRTYDAPLGNLPDGAMVALLGDALDDDRPYLVWQRHLWQWSFGGYTRGLHWDAPQLDAGRVVRVLTPQPTVEVLAAGYPVQLHPTLLHLTQQAHLSSPLESGSHP